MMDYKNFVPAGTPVVLRTYVSGVFVGRIAFGFSGTVGITDWRWLRRWGNVGNTGSVYDLVVSNKKPTEKGPFVKTLNILNQADVMVISEETYERLSQ